MAEALLNAPAIVGSLDLLLNPTGFFHSIGQGFEDLVSLPLAALEARSPSQVDLKHLSPHYPTPHTAPPPPYWGAAGS